jgi:ATP/maltotriose-dependent transcriptional regulator MalT
MADLARAGQDAADLIASVAVLGGKGPLHLAAEVAAVKDPLAALERAVAVGVLVEEFSTGVVRFRRLSHRVPVYQQYLGPCRRAALHARAARLAGDPDERLWHRGEATVGPDRALAEELAGLGRRLSDRGRWAEAVSVFRAAARLAPELSDQLDLEAAEARIVAGEADLRALAARVACLPRSPWRSYVLGLVELSAGRLGAAEPLLGDAWQTTDSALRAKVAGRVAVLRLMQGHGQSELEWTAVAGSAAELGTLLGRACLRIREDDLSGARRDLEGVLAAGTGLPVMLRMLARVLLADIGYLSGDWDGALTQCARAIALAEETGHLLLAPPAGAVCAMIQAARGEWARAGSAVQAAHAEGGLAHERAARAAVQLAFARGDAEGLIDAWPAGPAPSRLPYDLLAEAMIALGRLADAEIALGTGAAGQSRSARAALARAQGNLHAARRDPEAAVAAFEVSLDLLRGLEMPFLTALTNLDFGSYLRRLNRKPAAARRLERARATFETLRARPYVERAARELSACARPPTADPTGAGLTARELAVAWQAAKGLTNRQIARELVVSVKTVEYHLSNVYPKLRIQSRTQLALLLTRR